MAGSLAAAAATRGLWAALPAGLAAQLEEWGLARAEYLVGLCEPGEAAAKEALLDLGLVELAADPGVVAAFAELRRGAAPAAEAAARRSASLSGPLVEAARCAAEREAKRLRTLEVEEVVAACADPQSLPPGTGAPARWPARLRRKLAEAGSPRARQSGHLSGNAGSRRTGRLPALFLDRAPAVTARCVLRKAAAN